MILDNKYVVLSDKSRISMHSYLLYYRSFGENVLADPHRSIYYVNERIDPSFPGRQFLTLLYFTKA